MSIASMRKADRSSTANVYVSGFVPCHLLPNKTPAALDPFLEPLLRDVENIFIEGIIAERLSARQLIVQWLKSQVTFLIRVITMSVRSVYVLLRQL